MAKKTKKQALNEQQLVRAFHLTDQERHVLRQSPYDAVGTDWRRSGVAARLAREGLLERLPGRTIYRVSRAGQQVLEQRTFLERLLPSMRPPKAS